MKGTPVRMVGHPIPRRTTGAAAPSPFNPFDIPTLMQMMQELSAMHTQVLEGVKAVQEMASKISDIKKGPPGMPGVPGAGVNHDAVVRDVLDSMRKPEDGKSPQVETLAAALFPLVAKHIEKKLPKQRIAVESTKPAEPLDPQVVADTVFTMLEQGKKKLKMATIEGLDGRIAELRNHVALAGKQYGKDTDVRGGGDTVVAGTGVTITNTVNGNKQINATAGGLTIITTATVPDDSTLIYAFASEPTLLNINGAFYRKTGGSYTWSYAAGNATLNSPVGTGGTIYGVS